jgi:hypothetical protein
MEQHQQQGVKGQRRIPDGVSLVMVTHTGRASPSALFSAVLLASLWILFLFRPDIII